MLFLILFGVQIDTGIVSLSRVILGDHLFIIISSAHRLSGILNSWTFGGHTPWHLLAKLAIAWKMLNFALPGVVVMVPELVTAPSCQP